MTITLGHAPQELMVVVSRGASFTTSMRRGDGEPWGDDLTLSLEFGSLVWPATLDGPVASWIKSAEEVDVMLAANPATVRLWWTSGDRRLLWATGRVSVR